MFLALVCLCYGYATFQANDIHDVTGYNVISSKHKIDDTYYLVVELSSNTYEIECDEDIYYKVVCSPKISYHLSFNYRVSNVKDCHLNWIDLS